MRFGRATVRTRRRRIHNDITNIFFCFTARSAPLAKGATIGVVPRVVSSYQYIIYSDRASLRTTAAHITRGVRKSRCLA